MSTQKFLPRFSDPRDVDEFVAKLEAFERSEIGADQFRAFRLVRGVYGQRQSDVQMMRVKIPFGRLVQAQLDALADVADQFCRGFGHVTTRQNVQFHFMQMSDVETVMRLLDGVGLTTREACGNSVRTVTACEVAEVCGGAAFDVTPYAEGLTRYFLRHPLAAGLPRKFKVAFSGCANDCAMAQINDLGFIAQVKDGERGFRVVAAGGLSTSPQAAIVLHDFIRAGEISRVGEAVLRLFNNLGNRENRHRARLKYVLKKLGEPKFRETYAELRAAVDAEAIAELALPLAPERDPSAVVTLDEGVRPPGLLAWKSSSVIPQKEGAYAGVYVRLFLGDITSRQMRAVGRLASQFGDGTVRLTIDQNLLIPWVDKRSLPALFVALEAEGLAKTGLHSAKDVLSCPGAESCNLAVTASRALAGAIAERLEEADAADLTASATTRIKISGCPNSCGQHHVADIGFHGGAKSVGGVTVPIYQLHLGGGVDATGAHFGRQVVKLVARRVPDAVVLLMKLFEEERVDGESTAEFYRRIDPKRVVARLAALLVAPTAEERSDIGESQGFQVDLKEGECAA